MNTLYVYTPQELLITTVVSAHANIPHVLETLVNSINVCKIHIWIFYRALYQKYTSKRYYTLLDSTGIQNAMSSLY